MTEACSTCGQRPRVAAALPVVTTNPHLERMLEDAALRRKLGYRFADVAVGGYVLPEDGQ